MTICHEPNGRNICFYSITHWGYSDVGGGVWGVVGNRLTSGKETRTSHKEHNFLVQATPEPYKCLNLLSQLQPLLKPPSDNQHLTRLLTSSFQFFQNWNIPVLDMRVTVSLTTQSNSLTLKLASQGNYTSRPPQKPPLPHATHWASL